MEKICRACGKEAGNDDLYCIHCGTPLASDKTENEEKKKEDPWVQEGRNAPLSFKDYLFMGLLFCIPVVNLIVLLVWALDKDANLNRRNFAKAGLVYMGISLVLSLVLAVGVFRAAMLDIQREEQYYYHQLEDYPDVDEWMHNMMDGIDEA